MTIKILGTGCSKCKKLEENAKEALQKTGLAAEVQKVTALNDIMKYTRDWSHLKALEKGLGFYQEHLFLEDGTPKYRSDTTYPIDIHNMQAIVTLVKCNHLKNAMPLAERIAGWMIAHMLDRKGYFYYHKGRRGINKIDYMRWGQAWAFHALTTLEQHFESSRRRTE